MQVEIQYLTEHGDVLCFRHAVKAATKRGLEIYTYGVRHTRCGVCDEKEMEATMHRNKVKEKTK